MLNYQPDFAACRRIEALLCWDGNNHADIVYAADTAGVTIPDRLAFEPGTRGQNGGPLAAQPAHRESVATVLHAAMIEHLGDDQNPHSLMFSVFHDNSFCTMIERCLR